MATNVTKTVGTGTAVTKTGTINAASFGSTAIVGTGTAFLTDYAANDVIIINNYAYRISSVNSNTSITLYQGNSAAIAGGSAHAKAGNQRDYKTLVEFQAAVPSNLITADQQWTAVCYNDSIFTEGYSHGKIGDATSHYVIITAAIGSRNNGKNYSSSGVRVNPTAFRHCFNATTSGASSYFIVEYFQALDVDGSSTLFSNTGAGSGDAITVRNCIGVSTKLGAPNHSVSMHGSNCRAYNNIIYGTQLGGILLINGACAYNNTIKVAGQGTSYWPLRIESSNCIAKYNQIFTTTNPTLFRVTGATEDYNVFSDTPTVMGSHSIPSVTASNQFVSVTGGSEDFTLKAGAVGIKYGAIVGETKTGTLSGSLKGDTTIPGTSTTFLTDYSIGDIIIIGGVEYVISAIASNTSLTISTPLINVVNAGTAHSRKLFSNDCAGNTRSSSSSGGYGVDVGAVKFVDPLQAYTMDFNDSFWLMGTPQQNRSVGAKASQTTGTASIDVSGYLVTLTGATFSGWGEGDKIIIGGDTNYIACVLLKFKMGLAILSDSSGATPFVAGEKVEFDGGMIGEYVSDDGVNMYIKYMVTTIS